MRPTHLSPPHHALPHQKAADVLLDAEQLGRFFNLGTARDGTARAALNMRISRGHPMPPCIDIPGMSGRRWLLSSVIQWLQNYQRDDRRNDRVDGNDLEHVAAKADKPARRRGRPTKSESLDRRRVINGG
jgi:hypothetical protein